MGVNKAEQSLEDKLINDIKELQNQILTLKTHPQPIGADQLNVGYSTTSVIGPTSVIAGDSVNLSLSYRPITDLVLTLFSFEFSVYIDGTAFANRYPSGSSLTSGMRDMSLQSWLDFEESLENTAPFTRTFKARIVNNDTITHSYTIKVIALYPQLTLT